MLTPVSGRVNSFLIYSYVHISVTLESDSGEVFSVKVSSSEKFFLWSLEVLT